MDYASELLAISRELIAIEDRLNKVARKDSLAMQMMDGAEYLPLLNTSGCAGDLVKIAGAISSRDAAIPCEEDAYFAAQRAGIAA